MGYQLALLGMIYPLSWFVIGIGFTRLWLFFIAINCIDIFGFSISGVIIMVIMAELSSRYSGVYFIGGFYFVGV